MRAEAFRSLTVPHTAKGFDVQQRIHISFETKYVRNEVSTEHMFRTTFTFRIARYSFRTKAIHTSFDKKFVSAQFALKFINAQCVYVNLAGCADWQTGNSDPRFSFYSHLT